MKRYSRLCCDDNEDEPVSVSMKSLPSLPARNICVTYHISRANQNTPMICKAA